MKCFTYRTGTIRAIDMGRKILGEGAEVITASHVALRCGFERWGVQWGKPLCLSRYGLGVGVECQVKWCGIYDALNSAKRTVPI